jgi:hypothetical protein
LAGYRQGSCTIRKWSITGTQRLLAVCGRGNRNGAPARVDWRRTHPQRGWLGGAQIRNRGGRDRTTGDERILGEGEFVESVLKEAQENIERRQKLQAQGYDFQTLVSRAGELTGLDVKEVMKPGKHPQRVQARSLVCYWAVIELGLVGTSVAKMLGMSQPAVSKAVQRGRRLAADMGYTLRGKLSIHERPPFHAVAGTDG